MRLHRFPGGLKLAPHKDAATREPSRPGPAPRQVVLPLAQHAGEPALPIVVPGQRVSEGQCIARAPDGQGASLHASIAGVVAAIEPRPVPHASGLPAPCIVINADGSGACSRLPPLPNWRELGREVLLERVRDAGIVGLGGAAFPTDIKLARPVETLVVNGAECEPFIACDDMLLRERPAEVLEGARILARVLDAAEVLLAIEDRMDAARAALGAALGAADDIRLIEVPTIFPEGGERQLIRVLTGREVPSGGLPRDIGVVCQNVGTAAAVARAVGRGEPLLSRYVTVTGRGVARPCTLEARLGTPVEDLIAAAGGYTPTAARLVMGGPMMGVALATDAVPLVKGGNCVLVLTADEVAPAQAEMPCIRCGDCVEVCPARLLPQQLDWRIQSAEWDEVESLALFDCIECGLCALVCPSHIPLVEHFRYAKAEIRHQRRQRRQAEIARDRFEARKARLAREAAEREARLAARRAAPAGARPGTEGATEPTDAA